MQTYCICTYKRSLIYNYYMYIDVPDNYSKSIFKEMGIFVHVVSTRVNKENDYILVECKTRKRNDEAFDICMEKLCSKMLIMGKRDYMEFASKAMNNLCNKEKENYVIECTSTMDSVYLVTVDADSINHKDFIVMPHLEDDKMSYEEVRDKIKSMIDNKNLKYRSMVINVRKFNTKESKSYTFINE